MGSENAPSQAVVTGCDRKKVRYQGVKNNSQRNGAKSDESGTVMYHFLNISFNIVIMLW